MDLLEAEGHNSSISGKYPTFEAQYNVCGIGIGTLSGLNNSIFNYEQLFKSQCLNENK